MGESIWQLTIQGSTCREIICLYEKLRMHYAPAHTFPLLLYETQASGVRLFIRISNFHSSLH